MKLTPKKIGLGMALLAGVLITISGSSVFHALVLMPVMFVVSTLLSGSVLNPNGLLSNNLQNEYFVGDDDYIEEAQKFSDSCNPLLIDSTNYDSDWISS